jgi:Peptidase A4 family
MHTLGNHRRLGAHALLLAGAALCIAAAPALAETFSAQEPASEKGYTIPPGVTTGIVMRALPGAACDLHTVGLSDTAHSLRFLANADGYFKIHVTPRQQTPEGEHMQIDCASAGQVTTYFLHVRASEAPTADMPAPETSMPLPSGSKVLPALTDSEAQSVSREELLARGYPPRPDAVASPDYKNWLDVVSRPLTLLPSPGAATEVSHHQTGVQEGPTNATNTHWSGFVANQYGAIYYGVRASWNVPKVVGGAGANTTTNSGFWVGLDGYPPSNDVEQAGTEQDFISAPQDDYAHYYAWTELYPAQPQAQEIMQVNSGDPMTVWVWIGDSDSAPDINGGYVWYYIYDAEVGQTVITHTALGYTYTTLACAEWIMERPLDTTTNFLDLLSNYNKAYMTNAYALIESGTWATAQSVSTIQLTMYNEDYVGVDNNELSSASFTGPTSITFDWHHFH